MALCIQCRKEYDEQEWVIELHGVPLNLCSQPCAENFRLDGLRYMMRKYEIPCRTALQMIADAALVIAGKEYAYIVDCVEAYQQGMLYGLMRQYALPREAVLHIVNAGVAAWLHVRQPKNEILLGVDPGKKPPPAIVEDISQ